MKGLRKKALAVTALVLLSAIEARSTLPVIDIQSIIHSIASYILQIKQFATEAESTVANQTTALQSIKEVEQSLEQLTRMGDPANFVNLPGIAQIRLLETIYQEGLSDLQKIDALTNPNNIKLTSDQILQKYNLQSFKGYTSGLGVTISAPNVQFDLSNYSTAQLTQQTVQGLIQRKQQINAQRDEAISEMKSASTQSEVQKCQAIIDSLNGSLADVNQSINQAIQSANLQQGMNNSAQGINGANQAAAQSAAYQASIETSIGTVNGVGNGNTISGQSSEFGLIDDPSRGGGGDPGLTSGNWYTGSSGAYVGGANSTGVAIPQATMIQEYGSVSAAMGQSVTVTDTQTGTQTTTSIVDTGPGSAAVARGTVVDLTRGTAAALGLPMGQSAPVTVQFNK
jgi:hypothetical protein